MPLPVIPGAVRITCAGVVAGGGRWSNTWHARRVDLGSSTGVEQAALATEFGIFYGGAIMPLCAAPTAIQTVELTPLDGTSGAIVFPTPVVGSSSDGALPPEVASVITIRTAARGRRARGRVYLPAFSKGHITTPGLLDSTTIGVIQVAVAALMVGAGVAGWEMGVASYGKSRKVDFTVTPHRVVETVWDPFFTPMTLGTVDDRLDVQRHRKF
jgi:hypothetical protein